MIYTFTVFTSSKELPHNWNTIVGQHNVLLSREYFHSLEFACPENMKCYFVAFFKEKRLIGGALFQYLNFVQHKTFQKSNSFFNIKNYITKTFTEDILILGNNMLTGQNGFYFDPAEIAITHTVDLLEEASFELQKRKKTSLITYKDYQENFITHFKSKNIRSFYKFSVQPNMILNLRNRWISFDDYLNALSTKYRTRAKSAKKKSMGIEKSEIYIEDLRKYQKEMNILYQNVAENAPFNTFFLPEDHFENLKESLNENFKVFGYFFNKRLIGFYTLILNNQDIDTYFLGYDKKIQKEKQIYLNMLLDMTEFGINQQFHRIIFGRTALEIKSTIGAEPVEIFGFIKHNNRLINRFMEKIFPFLNPKVEWIQRKPFKYI